MGQKRATNRWADATAITGWNGKQRDMAYRVHVRYHLIFACFIKTAQINHEHLNTSLFLQMGTLENVATFSKM
jgi:hypothetical protein